MDGLPAPQPKRTQSIFKSSICSPEGPVKNQFSNQEAAELHKGQLPLLFRRAGGGPEMQAAADLLVKGDAGIHIRRIHGNVAETLIVLFHTISPPVCEK